MKILIDAPMFKDPELALGGIVTLERADGRTVWRQRLKVRMKLPDCYVVSPVDDSAS